ncbi:hypothetical protein RSAG8_02521, partial [Rhizoctonia solani AG-8 WAC10335]
MGGVEIPRIEAVSQYMHAKIAFYNRIPGSGPRLPADGPADTCHVRVISNNEISRPGSFRALKRQPTFISSVQLNLLRRLTSESLGK